MQSHPVSSVFIYRPKSGDKVFVEENDPSIRVTRWPNGCRHVQGGVHLSWDSAQPRNWWREEGKAVLAHLIPATRGIAWDDCGILHCVIPRGFATSVREAICHLRGQNPRLVDSNAMALVAQGCGELVPVYTGQDDSQAAITPLRLEFADCFYLSWPDIDLATIPLPVYKDWHPC